MDFRTSTRLFQRWLASQTPIALNDLRHKHLAMKTSAFCFLRATYYRWAQQFPSLDAITCGAPTVLAVGDLHLENFGTWRDAVGRLAWGINDFDEAFPLPYTHDLVRLATSALLAIEQDHLGLKPKLACAAILDGYREGLKSAGRPFVIGDEHRWFKPILATPQRDPGLFWDKLRALPRVTGKIPRPARQMIAHMMPEAKIKFTVHHRLAGLGNLGKPRYTGIAEYCGGPVAREVKSLTLSAAAWASSKTDGPFYARILQGAVRSPDPFLTAAGRWVVRRLSPDCRRLEVESLARVRDEQWLLHAMGFETANVHLNDRVAVKTIRKHLAKYLESDLKSAAVVMKKNVQADFEVWRKR